MPLKRSTSLAMPLGRGRTGENGKQGVPNSSITTCSAEQLAVTLAMVSNMPRAHYTRRHRNSDSDSNSKSRKSKNNDQRSRSSSDNSGNSSEGPSSHVKKAVPSSSRKKQQYQEQHYGENAAVSITADKQKQKEQQYWEDAAIYITADKQKQKEQHYWEDTDASITADKQKEKEQQYWEDAAVYITADKQKQKKQHYWEDTAVSITVDKQKEKEQHYWEDTAFNITADKKKQKEQHYWEDTAFNITADKKKQKEQHYWEDTNVSITAAKQHKQHQDQHFKENVPVSSSRQHKEQHYWEDTDISPTGTRQHKQRQDQYYKENVPVSSSRQHKQHKEQHYRNGMAGPTTTTTTTATTITASTSASRNSPSFKASSREVHVKALGELQTAAARLPHPEVVYGAMIPEPDYSDDERDTTVTKQAALVSRNNQVNASSPVPKEGGANTGRLDEKGLIMPKKLVNPCLESSEKKNLHRELLYNQKRGVNVLNQKSELQKAMEKHNDKKVLKEIQKEKEAALTPFQKALDERAQKLEQMEKAENKDPENDKATCEFQKIHAKVRAKMEVQ